MCDSFLTKVETINFTVDIIVNKGKNELKRNSTLKGLTFDYTLSSMHVFEGKNYGFKATLHPYYCELDYNEYLLIVKGFQRLSF